MMIKKLSAARQAAAQARKNRGLSLAEAGLVLALGMLVAVIAFAGYSYGSNSIKTRSQVSATIELVNNVVRTYSSAANYTGLTHSVMVDGRLVPSGFRSSGTAGAGVITNTWGGNVTVGPVAPDNAQFTVTLEDVPASACVDFVTGVASIANGITVDSAQVKPAGATTVDIGLLTTNCATLVDGDTIVITTA